MKKMEYYTNFCYNINHIQFLDVLIKIGGRTKGGENKKDF